MVLGAAKNDRNPIPPNKTHSVEADNARVVNDPDEHLPSQRRPKTLLERAADALPGDNNAGAAYFNDVTNDRAPSTLAMDHLVIDNAHFDRVQKQAEELMLRKTIAQHKNKPHLYQGHVDDELHQRDDVENVYKAVGPNVNVNDNPDLIQMRQQGLQDDPTYPGIIRPMPDVRGVRDSAPQGTITVANEVFDLPVNALSNLNVHG